MFYGVSDYLKYLAPLIKYTYISCDICDIYLYQIVTDIKYYLLFLYIHNNI